MTNSSLNMFGKLHSVESFHKDAQKIDTVRALVGGGPGLYHLWVSALVGYPDYTGRGEDRRARVGTYARADSHCEEINWFVARGHSLWVSLPDLPGNFEGFMIHKYQPRFNKEHISQGVPGCERCRREGLPIPYAHLLLY